MKLWKKGATAHQKVDFFTVGKDREYDLFLAEYDCLASIAHAKMLGKIGILSNEEVNPTSVVSPIRFSDLLIINSVCVSPVSGILNVALSPVFDATMRVDPPFVKVTC